MSELHVYDFDGTLFRSPEKPDWWTGKFWWFDPQSLDEPCVPERPGGDWWIGSTVSQAKRSIADPNVWAILMTGRSDKRFRWRVPELLKQVGLKFDEVHLAPSGSSTEYFKVSVLKGILQRYPHLTAARFWDDNTPNLKQFKAVAEKAGLKAETHAIKVPAHHLFCGPESIQRVARRYMARRR